MIVPLDELIDFNGNRYELTCAAIKRAIQINLTGDEELRKNREDQKENNIEEENNENNKD